MPTTIFRLEDRSVALENAKSAIKSLLNGGPLQYNLYGYYGASGIGKSALLQAIDGEIRLKGIVGLHSADGLDTSTIVKNIQFCETFADHRRREPAISIIDNVDQLDNQVFDQFKKNCYNFVKVFVPKRVIFCSSKQPHRIAELLEPDQRFMHELSSLSRQDSLNMLNQISSLRSLTQDEKEFLIEYAGGYPKMIEIFGDQILATGLSNHKEFLWRSMLRLAQGLFQQPSSSVAIEQLLARLCFHSLPDGFMPSEAIKISELAAEAMTLNDLAFTSHLHFVSFNNHCTEWGITKWEVTDFRIYPPLQDLLRKYMSNFEKQTSVRIYHWLVREYGERYIQEKTDEKGRCLLKLCFYIHQLDPADKDAVYRNFSTRVKDMVDEGNVDALTLIRQELRTSDLGKALGVDKFLDLLDHPENRQIDA